jgi:hypothetical protein
MTNVGFSIMTAVGFSFVAVLVAAIIVTILKPE